MAADIDFLCCLKAKLGDKVAICRSSSLGRSISSMSLSIMTAVDNALGITTLVMLETQYVHIIRVSTSSTGNKIA